MRDSSLSSTARHLGALGNLAVEQFFDGQRIHQVVVQWIKVIGPVGQHHRFLIGFRLDRFFDPCMQEADFRCELEHRFAGKFDRQPQHAVGRWMVRTHVQHHRLVHVAGSAAAPRWRRRSGAVTAPRSSCSRNDRGRRLDSCSLRAG